VFARRVGTIQFRQHPIWIHTDLREEILRLAVVLKTFGFMVNPSCLSSANIMVIARFPSSCAVPTTCRKPSVVLFPSTRSRRKEKVSKVAECASGTTEKGLGS
jgi:hypothetical protein